jgi:hypothetical protein
VRYLGLQLFANRGLLPTSEGLCAAGLAACFALDGSCKAHGLTKPAFKLRLFNALVWPILGYGAQVWGPDALLAGNLLAHPLETIHINYLRSLGGWVRKTVDRAVLLREFGRDPLFVRWAGIVAVFWVRLAAMPAGQLARRIFTYSVRQALGGNDEAWAPRSCVRFSGLGSCLRAALMVCSRMLLGWRRWSLSRGVWTGRA